MCMSTESVIAIVSQITTAINLNLDKLHPPANKTSIHHAFYEPIKDAFKQLNAAHYKTSEEKEADRKTLYRKLLIQFHPDKIASSQKNFAVKLRALTSHDTNLLIIPQQIIEEQKNMTGSVKATLSGLRTNHWQDRFNSIKRVVPILAPIFNEYTRYSEPARSIIGYGRWLIFTGLIIESCYL